MAVTKTEEWSTIANGTEPNGSTPIGSGENKMLVYIILRERGTDFTVSTFTVGGVSYDYSGEVRLDSTPDLIIKAFFWDDASIESMSSDIIDYTDDVTGLKIGWSFATFANTRQQEPIVASDTTASGTYVDITSTSTSNDMLIGALIDKSANRDPFDYDTLTERTEYGVDDFAIGIADGSGGDSTTRLSNDGTTSALAGMVITLKGFATSLTDSAGRGVMRGVSRGIM